MPLNRKRQSLLGSAGQLLILINEKMVLEVIGVKLIRVFHVYQNPSSLKEKGKEIYAQCQVPHGTMMVFFLCLNDLLLRMRLKSQRAKAKLPAGHIWPCREPSGSTSCGASPTTAKLREAEQKRPPTLSQTRGRNRVQGVFCLDWDLFLSLRNRSL